MTTELERLVRCENPRWIGATHVRDIHLSNGEIHEAVTQRDIEKALGELHRAGKISLYDSYIDVVRKCHIDWYNEWHTRT